MTRDPMTIEFMRDHPRAIPPVRVRISSGHDIVETQGWVRFPSRKPGIAYIIVHRDILGPLFIERTLDAVSRAVNQGEVIVE